MRIIAIVNQKGGCGKTTTAINLAAVFARRGVRTLLADMDPQSHCAAGLGVPETRIECGIGEAMLQVHDARFEPDALLWEVSRNLDLAPSTTRLAALEAPGGGLHELPDRDRRLLGLLERLHDRFDLCLVDCPPTIGLLTFNALRAAHEALIPVETGYFALQGAEKQWKTIQRVIDRIDRPIHCHLLPTLFDPTSALARNILDALHRRFDDLVAEVVIRLHESLREAASFGQPIVEYAPESGAHQDFEDLADWLEEASTGRRYSIDTGEARNLLEHPPQWPSADGPSQHETSPPHHSDTADESSARATPAVRRTNPRAAELVERVRRLALQNAAQLARDAVRTGDTSADRQEAVRVDDQPARRSQDNSQAARAPDAPQPLRQGERSATRPISAQGSLGTFQTAAGVHFVQPGEPEQSMQIVGDFNDWRPNRHVMAYDAKLGVFRTILRLSPGRYRYRLVVDGQAQPDPYNQWQVLSEDERMSSVLIVEEVRVPT